MKELRIGNKDLIKDINNYLVMNEIRKNSPISRAEISKNTGLAQSTITNIVNVLIKNNFVLVVGDGKSTGGRKPIKLSMNSDFGYSIAVKIETNHLIVSICNMIPEIIKQEVVNFKKNASFEEVRVLLLTKLKELIKHYGKEKQTILGIGVTVSGIVNQNDNSKINSSLLGWYDIDIKAYLENELKLKTYVENDVNSLSQYHKEEGLGKELSDFICITVGEGIGSGTILNNQLFRGYFGGAGEFGHQIIQPEGRQCYCGQKGCLEMYSSEEAMLSEIADLTGRKYTYQEVFSDKLVDIEIVKKALNKTLRYLSYGIVNLIMQLNPQEIIIGFKKELFDYGVNEMLTEYINQNWFHNLENVDTKLRFSALSNNGFILGIASMVVEEVLRNPVFTGYESIV
jgi:predicted NBD/HSP70 family sugar kinase